MSSRPQRKRVADASPDSNSNTPLSKTARSSPNKGNRVPPEVKDAPRETESHEVDTSSVNDLSDAKEAVAVKQGVGKEIIVEDATYAVDEDIVVPIDKKAEVAGTSVNKGDVSTKIVKEKMVKSELGSLPVKPAATTHKISVGNVSPSGTPKQVVRVIKFGSSKSDSMNLSMPDISTQRPVRIMRLQDGKLIPAGLPTVTLLSTKVKSEATPEQKSVEKSETVQASQENPQDEAPTVSKPTPNITTPVNASPATSKPRLTIKIAGSKANQQKVLEFLKGSNKLLGETLKSPVSKSVINTVNTAAVQKSPVVPPILEKGSEIWVNGQKIRVTKFDMSESETQSPKPASMKQGKDKLDVKIEPAYTKPSVKLRTPARARTMPDVNSQAVGDGSEVNLELVDEELSESGWELEQHSEGEEEEGGYYENDDDGGKKDLDIKLQFELLKDGTVSTSKSQIVKGPKLVTQGLIRTPKAAANPSATSTHSKKRVVEMTRLGASKGAAYAMPKFECGSDDEEEDDDDDEDDDFEEDEEDCGFNRDKVALSNDPAMQEVMKKMSENSFKYLKMYHELKMNWTKQSVVYHGRQMYKCPECPVAIVSKGALKRHVLSVHRKIFRYTCYKCGAGSQKFNVVRNHKCKNATLPDYKAKKQYCDVCEVGFDSKHGYNRHNMVVHSVLREPNGSYRTADQCTDDEAAFIEMLQNMTVDWKACCVFNDGQEIIYKCPECKMMKSRRSALKTHILNVHRKIYRYYCPLCRAGSQKQSILYHHGCRKVEKPNKSLLCSECGMVFNTHNLLQQHQKRHSDERKYVCDLCGRKFKRPSVLESHVRCVHEQRYRFTCEKCGYGSDKRSQFELHVCGLSKRRIRVVDLYALRSESQGSALEPMDQEKLTQLKQEADQVLHDKMANPDKILVKTPEGEFGCILCFATFRSTTGLAGHELRVHSDTPVALATPSWAINSRDRKLSRKLTIMTEVAPDGKPLDKYMGYPCPSCNKCFTRLRDLRQHMKSHQGGPKAVCSECGTQVESAHQLTVHIQTHHQDTLYYCATCGRGFRKQYYKDNHRCRAPGYREGIKKEKEERKRAQKQQVYSALDKRLREQKASQHKSFVFHQSEDDSLLSQHKSGVTPRDNQILVLRHPDGSTQPLESAGYPLTSYPAVINEIDGMAGVASSGHQQVFVQYKREPGASHHYVQGTSTQYIQGQQIIVQCKEEELASDAGEQVIVQCKEESVSEVVHTSQDSGMPFYVEEVFIPDNNSSMDHERIEMEVEVPICVTQRMV